MAKKDIVTKEILKNIARDISRHILKLEVSDDIELIDKEFCRVEKREADLLFKSKNKIIHIEIQNNNHNAMHKRMLRYFSDIYFEYDNYEIKQFVLYIGREKLNMVSKVILDKISFEYDIIDIAEVSCEKFLTSDDPSAIALAILCDFEDKQKQEVVNTIIKRLLETCDDELEFRSHFKMLEILSTNRDLANELKKGEDMLVVDIEKLPSYELGLEKGLQKGLQKGLKSGLRQVAMSMIKLGVDEKIIKQSTKLSDDELEKLKQEIM